jgi:hypothetical protein
MHCASCLQKVHRHGAITYFHQMLGAAMMHPDRRAVMPLLPEPIVKHDGTDKNDTVVEKPGLSGPCMME